MPDTSPLPALTPSLRGHIAEHRWSGDREITSLLTRLPRRADRHFAHKAVSTSRWTPSVPFPLVGLSAVAAALAARPSSVTATVVE